MQTPQRVDKLLARWQTSRNQVRFYVKKFVGVHALPRRAVSRRLTFSVAKCAEKGTSEFLYVKSAQASHLSKE